MRRKWFDKIKLGSNFTKANFETGTYLPIKNNLFLKCVSQILSVILTGKVILVNYAMSLLELSLCVMLEVETLENSNKEFQKYVIKKFFFKYFS